MKYKKITAAVAFLLLFACLFCSCDKKAYKSDISAETLGGSITALFPIDGGYYTGDDDILTVNFPGAANVADFAVYYANTSTNMNEIGIFRLSDNAGATAMKLLIDTYLASKKASWMPNYLPDEKPKIDNAQSAVFGNYAVYAVMTESDSAKFFSEFEKLIIK